MFYYWLVPLSKIHKTEHHNRTYMTWQLQKVPWTPQCFFLTCGKRVEATTFNIVHTKHITWLWHWTGNLHNSCITHPRYYCPSQPLVSRTCASRPATARPRLANNLVILESYLQSTTAHWQQNKISTILSIQIAELYIHCIIRLSGQTLTQADTCTPVMC